MGAVMLVAASAGYGLVLVDQRLGTLHLSPGELHALRSSDTGALPPDLTASATGFAANGSTQLAPGSAGAQATRSDGDAVVHLSQTTATRHDGGAAGHLASSDAARLRAGAAVRLARNETARRDSGPDAHRSKDLPADASANTPLATDRPVAIAPVAPRAYLASVAPDAPTDRRYVIRRILPIDGPIRYGEWHWDEAGVPPGPLVITVDLEARVISAFRAGYEIGTAAVLLGTAQYPTPTGVFPISQKDAHHVSNIYDAPMPYMMRLTSDGVTIHGSNVRNGFASHGCIGVPMAFAKLLYDHVHLGDRVYITRGKQVGLGDRLVDR